jgi:hypothetical protein
MYIPFSSKYPQIYFFILAIIGSGVEIRVSGPLVALYCDRKDLSFRFTGKSI